MERGNLKLRFLDSYLGPLLVVMAAVVIRPLRWRRKRIDVAGAKRIGLLKSAAIGDTVLLSALIADIRKAYSDARVTLFVGSSNEAFARTLAGVDSVVKLPLTHPLKSLFMIRREKVDLMIDTDPWPRISALLAGLSGGRLTLGFKTKGQRRHFLYDVKVEHSDQLHELENYRNLGRAIGISASSPPDNLGQPWSGTSSSTCVFHLWAGGFKSHLREWPADRWIELAHFLMGQGLNQFVLTGGPTDFDKNTKFIENLPLALRSKFVAQSNFSFAHTIETLSTARLLVSVNTGVMHLGAAIGVPLVALHGPTNPKRWGPVGARVVPLLSSSPGAGHLNLGFEYSDDENRMLGLEVKTVERACERLMRESRNES